MGQKIVLTGSEFTDSTLPKLRTDPILADAGSLMLLDFGHSLTALTALPGHQVEIASVAGYPTVMTRSVAMPAGSGLIELTGKKGIHVIRSQTVTPTAGTAVRVALSAGLKAYLEANLSNTYYLSYWYRNTRAGSVTEPLYVLVASSTAPTANFLFLGNHVGLASGGTVGQSSKTGNWQTVVGNGYQQQEVIGKKGTVTTLGQAVLFGFNGWAASGVGTLGNSQILYRVYLEDLTVSGRTFAEVKAIDDEMRIAAFAEGGKFYGDTFTDPATIP